MTAKSTTSTDCLAAAAYEQNTTYCTKHRCKETPTPANPGVDTKSHHSFHVTIETTPTCNREVKTNKDNGENNDTTHVYVSKKEYIVGAWVVDKSQEYAAIIVSL